MIDTEIQICAIQELANEDACAAQCPAQSISLFLPSPSGMVFELC